ncbi:hypothetical protein B0H63DRAFT_482951 [Podospora didyma]|uniref:LRR-containing protein second PH domain-containing protein n=1 Tax=Podospora didyma TaxID=330526 RepID=A0AAE0KEW3_9PEZI|nr:hypothetical protein B0H63DRAFT_482951 [Podospora didyma]
MTVPTATMDLRRNKVMRMAPLTTNVSNVPEITTQSSPALVTPKSPASSEGSEHARSLSENNRSFSLTSIRHKARKSFSGRESVHEISGSLDKGAVNSHVRKLSKSRARPSSPLDTLSRRGSTYSDDNGRVSLADTASTTSSSYSLDWRTQSVEGYAALERDTQLLRTKAPYLVVTTDYLVKLKSHADVVAVFPHISEAPGGAPRSDTNISLGAALTEPLVLIPIAAIVSVFVAESTRPSFGIEIWWRNSTGISFRHTTFFFTCPMERDEQLYNIVRAMRGGNSTNSDENDTVLRREQGVAELLKKVQEVEEPRYPHRKFEFYPVVPRGITRKECIAKPEDASSKKLQESSAFYLMIGTYLCYLVEIQKPVKGSDPIVRHRSFGLVTLDNFRGDWTLHQERFNITFRDPFKAPVTLELASRHYRQIIQVFGTADRFLKPVWPQLWQTLEIFRVSGLKEPQYLVPREDFGSVKRTLDAYLAAYRCSPVDWEINWKTKYAPEFRLLPAKDGSRYSPLQLLAVLRALRYNDYFNSLSFRDIDLAVLWGVEDHDTSHSARRTANVAYLSRTCVSLGADEVEILKISPVLHQEFHALAFCSENIRQIDFTNCSTSLPSRASRHAKYTTPNLQFLTPILNLLKSGITKCNRLILSGNTHLRSDIEDLVETMKTGSIQALDVSFCGLDDMDMRDLVVSPLLNYPQSLQSLQLTGNLGRLPAYLIADMIQYLADLKELRLCGSLQGTIDGPLIPLEVFERLELLEELDISNFKINEPTVLELETFLYNRSLQMESGRPSSFRKLVLNQTGITGRQVARLFNAIGEDHGIHMCVNGNPIEDGVEDLAAAIQHQRGPIGLNMEMVEFRDESLYMLLIRALTDTRYLSFLSLSGTAPPPSPLGPLSPELVGTLENFFACNRSIRFLDMSGYCGRLEDGQLAKGFAGSLMGLAKNHTLTHLRVRNQNLHDDAGMVANVLGVNRHLLLFDCQENNLNLTSLKHLVGSFKNNHTIIEFPFSSAERASIWKGIVRSMQRRVQQQSLPVQHRRGNSAPSSGAVATKSASSIRDHTKDISDEEKALILSVFNKELSDLDSYLQRNRRALEQRSGIALEFYDSPTGNFIPSAAVKVPQPDDSWPPSPIIDELLAKSCRGLSPSPTIASATLGEVYAAVEHERCVDANLIGGRRTRQPRRPTVRSSSIAEEDESHTSYHIALRHIGVDGLESPTDTLDPVSETESPGSGEGDADFKKMMMQFTEVGFV